MSGPPTSKNETNPETVIRLPLDVSPAGQVGTTGRQGSEPNASNLVVGNTLGTGAEIRQRRKRGRPKVELDTLVASSHRYLEALTGYGPNTIKDMERRLRNVCKDICRLWNAAGGQPRVATLDPSKFTVDDIKALMDCWHKRGLKRSYQAKLLDALNGFLLWRNNSVISLMRKMKHVQFPEAEIEDIVTVASDQMECLRSAANLMDGWKGSIARFIVNVLPNCGLRPSEFRTQELAGVDVVHWRIIVTHPKGEDKYKRVQRTAVVAQAGRQALMDFIQEREAYLNGERHVALIPWRFKDRSVDFLGQHVLVDIKAELERLSGVKFKLKDFRATFCQTYIDRGIRTDKVSQAMRHSSTKVTEAYYGRIKSEDAFKDFDEPPVKVVPVKSQSGSP